MDVLHGLHEVDQSSLYVAHLFSQRSQLTVLPADASAPFKAVAEANANFLSSLQPLVGERNVSLANMYNVFDYMNVNYIHNAQFRQSVTEQQMVRLLLSLLLRFGRSSSRSVAGTSTCSGGLPRTSRLLLTYEGRHWEYRGADDLARYLGSDGQDRVHFGSACTAVYRYVAFPPPFVCMADDI